MENINLTNDGNFEIRGNRVYGYRGRKKCVEIPEGIEYIAMFAFSGHKSHKKIVLPSSLKIIEYGAFSDCVNLEELVIPNGVRVIRDAAFNGCKSLTSVTIPGSVNSVPDRVFSHCSSLRSVTVCEGVKALHMGCFWKCESLAELNLPASLNKLYETFNCRFFNDIRLNVHPSFMELVKDEDNDSEEIMKMAIHSFLRRYYSGEISESDSAEWRVYISRRTVWLFKLLGEDPSLYRYLTIENILSVKRAEVLLDTTQNAECRVLLLNYLDKRKKKKHGVDAIVDSTLSLDFS